MVNEPQAERATVIVLSSTSSIAKVEFDGQAFEFALADKVQKYNPIGLQVGKVYDISFNADEKMLFYAKLSENQPIKSVAAAPPSNDIQELILAQVCLKVASNLAKDTGECMNITQELFEWMQNKGYKE